MLTTASFATSKQILHSNEAFDSPLPPSDAEVDADDVGVNDEEGPARFVAVVDACVASFDVLG